MAFVSANLVALSDEELECYNDDGQSVALSDAERQIAVGRSVCGIVVPGWPALKRYEEKPRCVILRTE